MEALSLKKYDDGWWIVDPNNKDVAEYGPYDTKAEAEDDKRGIERFWKSNKGGK